jgi:hypothetical protein
MAGHFRRNARRWPMLKDLLPSPRPVFGGNRAISALERRQYDSRSGNLFVQFDDDDSVSPR